VEINQGLKPKPEHSKEMLLIEKGDIKIHVPLCIWVESSRAILEGLRTVL
jgi:hypothetical protein